MNTLLQDLLYSGRISWKRPGFTAVITLTLALGIGANTAIFSVVDRLLVRMLPVNEPERLVNLSGRDEKGNHDTSFSYPIYKDYRDQNGVFDGLLAYSENAMNLIEGGQPERIMGALVSGNYFDTLGVTPALGRAFLPEEDRTPGTHPVAVVSYGLWQRRFGADPRLVGRTITLNTSSFTVIGVAPAEFRGVRRGLSPDIYVPLQMTAQAWPSRKPGDLDNRNFSWLNLVGRLKPGVTVAQAQTSMSSLSSRILQLHLNTWPMITLEDGSQGETGEITDLRTPLKLLMATVALVLLIACVNVANLLLARAASRSREMAVRLAVGASRYRLIRQLLTESLLLSLLGGLLGLLLAMWLTDVLAAYSPPTGGSGPPLLDARLDWRVFAFATTLSLLTGLLFGLVPAWRSSKPNLTVALKEESAAAGSRRTRGRGALVSAQIALSLVVLVCAGLCARSLFALQRIDAGFETAKVLVMGLNLSLNGYKEEQGIQFYANLLERVSAAPGVEAASLARIVPLGGGGMRMSVGIEGYTPIDDKPINLDMNIVGPRYCATMKLPLIAGRDFTVNDNAGAAPVVIINEAAARTYWPNQNPLGKHLMVGSPGQDKPQPVEIIGVVGASRYRSLTEAYRPGMLFPAAQNYTSDLSLHLRSAGNPALLIESARRELRALDPQLPATSVRTLEEQRRNSLYSERVTALLLSAFGGLALLLAALGIYGVMSYAVTQRTREIGVRMALGARASDVLRLLLRLGVRLIVAGVALGLAGAFAATRLIRSFLYQVSATDPLTFVLAALLLASVALLACYIPARRATKVDPMIALRSE
ncbi:MAG TPA: ABC transporter permease [Blastocatellia bacterium]|nr:ABC transporter permease [Blastocatellia bacterium]